MLSYIVENLGHLEERSQGDFVEINGKVGKLFLVVDINTSETIFAGLDVKEATVVKREREKIVFEEYLVTLHSVIHKNSREYPEGNEHYIKFIPHLPKEMINFPKRPK